MSHRNLSGSVQPGLRGEVFAEKENLSVVRMKDHTRAAALACLIGLAGNFACVVEHVCMAGHMHHPPYGFADHALDVGWMAALILAAWWVGESQIKRRRLFSMLSIGLVFSRFAFGSLGGRAMFWEAPIALYLAVVSAGMGWRSFRERQSGDVSERSRP